LNRQKDAILLLTKVVTTYIGTIIGAGFASGQEIMQFFILHGREGLWGATLATFLFAYLGGLVMLLSITMRSVSYREILSFLLGARAGKFMDFLNLIMLLGGLCVMMAGSAAVFGEHFGLPDWTGAMLVAALTSLVIMRGLDGVLTANIVLVPLKFLAIMIISISVLCNGVSQGEPQAAQHQVSGGVTGHWALAGFLYVSYNIVVPVAVLSTLGRTVPLKLGVAGGILGGLLLGLTVFIVTAAGLPYMPKLASHQIPLLYLAGNLGDGLRWALGILIWLAILTTAIADAHGFASRLAPGGGFRYRAWGIGACLLVLPLSEFSFSGLVRLLYPLFGYAGMVLLLSLLLIPFVNFFRKR